jgi:Kef-type K+ transport system membrane component KefB/Trk K+ transport system NAD-binding subunit
MDPVLFDISIIIIAAAGIGIIAKFLKQPPVLAYIISGLVIGPFGLKLIHDVDFVKNIGELGIALLLFVVGLELSVERLKKVGGSASLIGLGEVALVTGVGYLLAIGFGFTKIEGVYIGLILAFSSTLVVVKMLSDSRELDTLHGRIMLGVLLVQDVIVIIALTLLLNTDVSAMSFVKMAAMGIGLILTALLSAKYILPLFFKTVAESQELLFIFALAWCFTFAGAAAYLGFSIAIGAFVAGVALANFPYNIEIIGRVKPIRDFFVTIFFVAIGIQIVPNLDRSLLLPMISFLLVVLLVKPIVIGMLSSIKKYARRTSFLSGFGMAQVSEFSIILAMQGVAMGQISDTILSIAIILTAITMLLTTYLIKYDDQIYHAVGKYLFFFNKRASDELSHIQTALEDHIVVFGADRMGRKIVEAVTAIGKNVIVVDYNPDIIQGLIARSTSCICGDAEDPEILERLELNHAYAIISTIPSHTTNRAIIRALKRRNTEAMFFSVAASTSEALKLYEDGADYVILPAMLAGEKLSDVLQNFHNKRIIDVLRLKQMVELERVRNHELLEQHAPSLFKHNNRTTQKDLLRFWERKNGKPEQRA